MFQKIKSKIKKSSTILLEPEGRERGAAISTGVIIGICAIVAALGITGVVVYYNWSSITFSLLATSLYILVGLSKWAFNFCANLFESVASAQVLKMSIVHDPNVLHGWAICRDLANMLVVLGFVVVGIATALRLKDYEAQKTLVPLIIVAILINFSTLICGIIIDGTNITMDYFMGKSGPAGLTTPLRAAVQNPQLAQELQQLQKSSSNMDLLVSKSLSLTALASICAMIFCLYGVLFVFRQVALMCLVVLSPLAFVCYVFGFTKSVFSKWWDQFFNWSLIGIPAAFFIYLGGHIIAGTNLAAGGGVGGGQGGWDFWLATGFLLFAYTLTFQSGALGAGLAIGLVAGAGRLAWGATKKAAGTAWKGTKKAGGALAGSRAGQAMKEKAVGWVAPRKATLMTGARSEKELKEAKTVAGINPDLAASRAKRGGIRGAAYAQAVGETKPDLLNSGHSASLTRGGSYGYKTSDIYKKRPDLAPNPAETMGGMTPGEAAQMSKNGVTPQTLAAMSGNQMAGVGRRAKPALVDEFKKYKHQGGQPLAAQTPEFRAWHGHVSTLHGAERQKAINTMHRLSSDANFT